MVVLRDFKKFVLRGNMVDLAVGFTVGAAFTTVVKSLVSNILMPPIGLVIGKADFSNLFWVLQAGNKPPPYQTLADAQAAGAVTLNIGSFLDNVIALLVVAAVMFVVVRTINRLDEKMEVEFGEAPAPELSQPTEKKCAHCLSTIPFAATRCPACTSHLTPAAVK